jgi:hypothetical protein
MTTQRDATLRTRTGGVAATSTADAGVIVVGMHRSGTSATTRVLNLLGLPTGERSDLWLELPGNPTGYWESSSLTRFNERLLNRFGSTWWSPLEVAAADGLTGIPELRAEGEQLFRRLHSSTTWVWKDPRVCLTLPFWRAVLQVPLFGVLVLRHPLEVAASLWERDGIGTEWALALWERYLRHALHHLAGLPVLVSDYTDLVAEPSGWAATARGFLAGQGVVLGEPPDLSIGAFVRPELRHTVYSEQDLAHHSAVSAEQLSVYRLLRAQLGAHDRFTPPHLPAESSGTASLLDGVRARYGVGRLPGRRRLVADAAFPARPARGGSTMTLVQDVPTVAAPLTPDWRRWVAENLMLQVPAVEIVRILGRHGVDPDAARLGVDSVRSDPCYQAGLWMTQRLRKLESVLDVYRDLQRLGGGWASVDRRTNLSREEFLREYYARNLPVMLPGLTDHWPARSRWTPTYLKDRFGDALVEVMSERESDEKYEQNCEQHKSVMRFGDYIDRISGPAPSNDLYLVANNHFFERPETSGLLADFEIPTEYLDPQRIAGEVFFWFGPAGTVTPLHHDVLNVLFIQMLGRKRITLIPSLQAHRMYNHVGVYSEVDLRGDREAHPLFDGTSRIEVCMEPGEALLIPVGWWHHVEALDTSISLSLTNFVFPNTYQWQHPEIVR